MSNKTTLTIIGVVIAVLVFGGIIYYMQTREPVAPSSDEAVLDELDALINAGAGIPDIQTSANPLDSVKPSENPIEKANPFTNEYQNPFE